MRSTFFPGPCGVPKWPKWPAQPENFWTDLIQTLRKNAKSACPRPPRGSQKSLGAWAPPGPPPPGVLKRSLFRIFPHFSGIFFFIGLRPHSPPAFFPVESAFFAHFLSYFQHIFAHFLRIFLGANERIFPGALPLESL
jgi:hypothetical protein